MKCMQCNREVALNRVCPYCGTPLQDDRATHQSHQQGGSNTTKGVFRGRLGRTEKHAPEPVLNLIPALMRYFKDRSVPSWRKNIIILSLLYVISPIDLVPGALVPLLGWLDDAAVATFAWRMLSSELALYRKQRT